LQIELTGIIDANAATSTSTFMDLPVVSKLAELKTLNALIVTDMENSQKTFDEAVQFFPRERIFTVPLLGVNRERADHFSFTDLNTEDLK
jgi:hypothetical protein